MNPILEAFLVVAIIALLVTLFFGAIFVLNHKMEQRAIANGFENPQSAPARRGLCDPQLEVPADREFTDLDAEQVGTVAPRGPSGSIEIICTRCQRQSNLLRALPNGDTVCPQCHEALILDAVFAPLE
jgi:hypothetical protein